MSVEANSSNSVKSNCGHDYLRIRTSLGSTLFSAGRSLVGVELRVYGESVLASEPPMGRRSVGFSQTERQPCFQRIFLISLQELAVSFKFFQYVFGGFCTNIV